MLTRLASVSFLCNTGHKRREWCHSVKTIPHMYAQRLTKSKHSIASMAWGSRPKWVHTRPVHNQHQPSPHSLACTNISIPLSYQHCGNYCFSFRVLLKSWLNPVAISERLSEAWAMAPLFLHFVLGEDVLARHYFAIINIVSHLACEYWAILYNWNVICVIGCLFLIKIIVFHRKFSKMSHK